MTNLNILKELRTREEVLNYFKQFGKNITEEELEALKQSYSKVQENDDVLTMQQLDDVAGGNLIFILDRKENILAFTHEYTVRLFSYTSEEPQDVPHAGTFTCSSYEGDAMAEGNTFILNPSDERYVGISILGSDHKQSFVGRIRESGSTSTTGWRELANFTEGMTDDQFDEIHNSISHELEEIRQDPEVITVIHTDGFLTPITPGELLEFSHNSDIDFLHMSDLADLYYKGSISNDLLTCLETLKLSLGVLRGLRQVQRDSISNPLQMLASEISDRQFPERMLEGLNKYTNFPICDSSTSDPVGARPSKRSRK